MKELSIRAAARDAGARPFVELDGQAHSFAALAARVDAQPDQDVLVAEGTLDAIVAILAALERQRPIVLVHPRLTASERAGLVGGTPAPGTQVVIYTSGTTGRPRGAQLSADNFVASARASGENLPLGPGDRWLLSMPLAHVGGLSILTRCLLARATAVVAPVGALPSCTLASLVPTMLARLLDDPAFAPPPGLRAILLGGAAAPAALLDRAVARRVPVLPTYGLTEACSQVATVDFAHRFDPRGQGVGRPLPGVELRAGDTLAVRGPTRFLGYLGEPPLPADAFFDTGDLGELRDGRLHIHARRTDLVISGGENVYPAEVEDVLARCPGVTAACVVGIPDETWGQRVAALVVGTCQEDELFDFVSAHLAPYKRPRVLVRVDGLPTTPAGKLDRRAATALATSSSRYAPSPAGCAGRARGRPS